MPYEKLSDLPGYVRKLPEKKQRQFVHVFNSCMKDRDDESRCFAMANGVVKKGLTEFELPAEGLGADFATGADVAVAEKAYQYVDEWEYASRQIPQDEAGYSPVKGDATKACSNCRFFISPARCALVAGEIAPNGLSNMWRAVKKYEPEPMPVVIVGGALLDKATSVGQREARGVVSATRRSLKQTIAALFGLRPTRPCEGRPAGDADGVCIIKQTDGRLRWFARYSNAWEDNDKELITEAAHKEYVAWAHENQQFPELWLWHVPGTRFGEADWLEFSDGFAHASGLIDKDKEHVVDLLAGQDLGVSHGFLSKQSGRYIVGYRTFEISVLPRKRAAVWTTDFNILAKEMAMPFSEDRRKFLVETLGEEAVKGLEQNTEALANQLKELGVEYKCSMEMMDDKAAKQQSALAGSVTDIMAAVSSMATAVKALSDRVEALSKSDDDKVADAFLARLEKSLARGGTRPTEDSGNVLSEKEAAGVEPPKDFFSEMIAKQLSSVSVPASEIETGTPAVGTVTIR